MTLAHRPLARDTRRALLSATPTSSARRAIESLENRRMLAAASGPEASALLERLSDKHGGGCFCGGCGAIQHLDMPLVSALPEQVARKTVSVRADGAFKDSKGGEFFFDAAPTEFAQLGAPQPADGGPGGGGDTGGTGFGLSVPIFHSNPSASQKVFLDFDGQVVSGTFWNNYNNGNPIHAQPYSTDDDVFNFSPAELASIEEIWRRVAEDFSPFNIDVTTEDPGPGTFTTGAQGIRVMISTDVDSVAMGGTGNRWFSGAGGVAYLGSWRWTSDTPVWVFENNLGNGFAKYVTEAASHEVGHALDLVHDGNNSTGYYGGHGTGPTGWAPLMGVGYNKPLSQWSKGEYANANNTEDDLAIITQASNRVVYRTDAVGGTIATASPVPYQDTPSGNSVIRQFDGSGIIETRGDVDMYKLDLTAGDGRLTLIAGPYFYLAGYNNLDIEAKLYRADGTLVQAINPLDDVDAYFDLPLTAGNYFLSVDGVGKGNPLADGYTDYGSLGQFDVIADYEFTPGGTTAFQEVNGRADFEAEQSHGQAPGSGSAANHTWTNNADATAGGGISLRATPNTGVNTNDNTNGPRRDYRVNFTNTGTYYVWVRIKGANGSDDSLHAGLDGVNQSTGSLGLSDATNQWRWVNALGNGRRVTVNVPTAGIRTVNLWMREDGVQADAFILTNDPGLNPNNGGGGGGGINETGGRVDFEAEASSASLPGTGPAAGKTWQQAADGGANGGQMVVAQPNTQLNAGENLFGPRRDYNINFSTTGTYYVWARVKGANGNDDSIHAGMNGAAATLGGLGMGDGTNQWVWVGRKSNGDRVTVNVPAAGSRTFNLWMREDGAKVDAFILTKDANFVPGGGGGGGGGVNFENLNVGNQGPGVYNDPAGFRFSSLPGTGGGTTTENLFVYGSGNGFASKVLHPLNFGRKIVVERSAGGAFGLTKFDYAAGVWADAGDATVTGFFSNGTTQAQTYAFSNRSLQTLTLNWSNLTKVEINFAGGVNGAYGALDNFTFAAGTAGLAPGFAPGLGSLFGEAQDGGRDDGFFSDAPVTA